MGVGARRKGTVHCGNCHRELEEARVRERAEWIAEMWAAGLRTGEIAAALGWTLGHVSREIVRIRKRSPGLLPYRRKTHAGRVLR